MIVADLQEWDDEHGLLELLSIENGNLREREGVVQVQVEVVEAAASMNMTKKGLARVAHIKPSWA